MPHPVTAQSLYEYHCIPLELGWMAGQTGANRQIATTQKHDNVLVGHLNLIRPCFVQVLGTTEMNYFHQQDKKSYDNALQSLFAQQPLMVIIAEGETVPDAFIALAEKTHTPLFRSPQVARDIINHIHYSLNNLLADKLVQHGVFMDVMGLGVLLTGASGVGKSELALELISRGHRLVADDVPEFSRTAPDSIHGSCPPLVADFLEVRGLGILNVRAMYGNNAVVANKRLQLIIQLQPASSDSAPPERLDPTHRFRHILEVEIPEVLLPLAPGRDLAVIIEAAVRNHVLYLNGYNAAEDFIARQQQEINKQNE